MEQTKKIQRTNYFRSFCKHRSFKNIGIAMAIPALVLGSLHPIHTTSAESCPDVKIIFARGSGGGRWDSEDYLEFKSTIESKLTTTSLSYEFVDLDYPAVAIGLEHIETSLGALFGAGEAYEFGDSVNAGVEELKNIVNSSTCTSTRYVLGGYSQGAMTVSKALKSLDADKIIYAATFGDPKIYLPEGSGLLPEACSGKNLSDYRMYVPDCQAYTGLLGSYVPYETEDFVGKLGTWCNDYDIFCSSHFSLDDHLSYVSDDLYEDASKVIFDKITDYYGIENTITSPHDTAILIDSTGSMSSMIADYKEEALRLAKETLESGGRVALYDYRDLADPYTPVEHCDFTTCTLETFEYGLQRIGAYGGGDTPESLLSASLKMMQELDWNYGSTKSLVVLTDANFLSPDRDGVTLDQVVELSKTIDPVNFYVITTEYNAEYYEELTNRTGGKVVVNLDELSLLTDYIMERYDSLPRVVEEDITERDEPTLEIKEVIQGEDSVTIKFETDGLFTMVAVNDLPVGLTEDKEITITGMKDANLVTLTPMGDDVRGVAQSVSVDFATEGFGGGAAGEVAGEEVQAGIKEQDGDDVLPKAPNTGRAA